MNNPGSAGRNRGRGNAGRFRKGNTQPHTRRHDRGTAIGQVLRKLLVDEVDQLLGLGFLVGGAALVVLEVAEGGGGVGLGAE